MTISPKARFMSEERVAKSFLDIVDSEAFQRASELTMIQLQVELSVSAVDSAHAFERIRGAQRFLELLKALPEPVKPPASKPTYGLAHDLK